LIYSNIGEERKVLQELILPPIRERGALHCPSCKCPLAVEGQRPGEYYCKNCKARIGRMTDELLVEMLNELPTTTAKEWFPERQLA
jgi:uncharacterized protein YbaR (Trm112 family)